MERKLSSLSSQQREDFFSLSWIPQHLPAALTSPQLSHDKLRNQHPYTLALAIFQTNAVTAGSGAVGIFPRMARLNHGCAAGFNVVYSYREAQNELRVYALKGIKKGEEVLTTYSDMKKRRSDRQFVPNLVSHSNSSLPGRISPPTMVSPAPALPALSPTPNQMHPTLVSLKWPTSTRSSANGLHQLLYRKDEIPSHSSTRYGILARKKNTGVREVSWRLMQLSSLLVIESESSFYSPFLPSFIMFLWITFLSSLSLSFGILSKIISCDHHALERQRPSVDEMSCSFPMWFGHVGVLVTALLIVMNPE